MRFARALSMSLTSDPVSNWKAHDAELHQRLASWKAPQPRYIHGVMAKYALLVSSSSLGAITSVPASFASGSTPVSTGRTL